MNATKYLSFLTLACLAVLAFYSTPTIACSCIMESPQYEYCNSKYVVVLRVLRKSTDLERKETTYQVEINKSYKMTPEGENALREGRLVTRADGSSCGKMLELGKLYVIAGYGPYIGLCSYAKEYESMSITEREGFSGMYDRECSSEKNLSNSPLFRRLRSNNSRRN